MDTEISVEPTREDEIVKERAVAYRYNDSSLKKTFPVYEGTEAAWWMDGGGKLDVLMSRFKMHDTVKVACYLAGLSKDQYLYFKSLHDWFIPLIRIYKCLPAAKIKDIVLEAAIGNPEKGIKPNAKIALGAYHIFEEPEDDIDFAPKPKGGLIPSGGSIVRTEHEAFLDSEGHIVMSRQMAERIENYGTESI